MIRLIWFVDFFKILFLGDSVCFFVFEGSMNRFLVLVIFGFY